MSSRWQKEGCEGWEPPPFSSCYYRARVICITTGKASEEGRDRKKEECGTGGGGGKGETCGGSLQSSRFRYSLFYVFGASSRNGRFTIPTVIRQCKCRLATFPDNKRNPGTASINKINETYVTAVRGGGGEEEKEETSWNNIRLFPSYYNGITVGTCSTIAKARDNA